MTVRGHRESGPAPGPLAGRGEELVFVDYRPGVIADIVGLHARYYATHWSFGAPFEAKVAGELAAFVAARNPERDLFLNAYRGRTLCGSITIDRTVTGSEGGERAAHLRWFIVDERARGSGLGRTLIRRAVAFCDGKDYAPVWLTTFRGLAAARTLYEAHGFALVGESDADRWQGGVVEQRFERQRAAAT